MRYPKTFVALRCITMVCCTLWLCSCLERKEHLVIQPDGRLAWSVVFATDSLEELTSGDAVPQLRGGWLADTQTRRDEDGKEHFVLTAEATFKPGGKLPANFANKTDADADLYTQFPTEIRIEKIPKGTYYHFSRVYQARPWATIELLRKQYVEEPMASFKGIEPREWTPEQRQIAIRGIADFETARMLLCARAAFRAATPDATPDRWLAVRSDMLDCAGEFDAAGLEQLLRQVEVKLNDDEQAKTFNEETRKFQALLEERLQHALKDLARYEADDVNAFMTEFARQRKMYAITEGLDDDSFEITLDMPGQIVIANADSINGSTAVWSFKGGLLRDHEIELLATSFVPR